ncbi:DUF6300 family protein [Streptomyces kanasensis]|uniref:DUF6300 family protein n=1 Tax=Streptomyces kanasensis TaxID=936756 RepID=UPI000A9E5F6B|nr:DUF6300 family protein [Streptomyces kanasensis]
MHHVELSDQLPSCSRCGGGLISSVVMPQNDASGRPIHLELCSVCDSDKPAAGALLRWCSSGGGHDTSRAQEGAELLLEWTKEGMAEHGWHWAESATGAAPPSSGPIPDDGAGRQLMNPGIPDDLSKVDRLMEKRDALRARLATAPSEERDQIRAEIRDLGRTVADALAEADVTAEALRATAPRPAPGPLSPEAEQRIRDLYQRLIDEQDGSDDA